MVGMSWIRFLDCEVLEQHFVDDLNEALDNTEKPPFGQVWADCKLFVLDIFVVYCFQTLIWWVLEEEYGAEPDYFVFLKLVER